MKKNTSSISEEVQLRKHIAHKLEDDWRVFLIADFIASEYQMTQKKALSLFKKSETYARLKDSEEYASRGSFALFQEFRKEYDKAHQTEEPMLNKRMPHEGLLEWMMSVYLKAKSNNFEWHPLYPNDMPGNGVSGTYTDMFFVRDGHFQYVRFTIEYVARCDENGVSHPEEGVKYYVLHLLDLTDDDNVNGYGRFRYVFDDKATARKVIVNELLEMVYPFTSILTDEESLFWEGFVKRFGK